MTVSGKICVLLILAVVVALCSCSAGLPEAAGREEVVWEEEPPPCPPGCWCVRLDEPLTVGPHTKITGGDGNPAAEIAGKDIVQILPYDGPGVLVVWWEEDVLPIGKSAIYRGILYEYPDGATLAGEEAEVYAIILLPGSKAQLATVPYMDEGWVEALRAEVSNPAVPPVEGEFTTQQR